MKLLRAKPIEFEIEDGRKIIVQPPSIQQFEDCIALDPIKPEEETAEQLRARTLRQAEILCGNDSAWLRTLDHHQLHQVSMALVAHAHGYDPVDVVSLHLALREIATQSKKKDVAASLQAT